MNRQELADLRPQRPSHRMSSRKKHPLPGWPDQHFRRSRYNHLPVFNCKRS